MAKSSVFVCQNCGEDYAKWGGRCANCGEWNTLVESKLSVNPTSPKGLRGARDVNSVGLSTVTIKSTKRVSTKLPELDRVLGGGLVPGQVVLLAGEPGIGKSTLLLQVAEHLGDTIYIAGEESPQQIKIRADRLGLKGKKITILPEIDADASVALISALPVPPKAIIVDSIQTITTSDLSGMAGSVGQVRESAQRFVRLAKTLGTPLFLVGHATKGKEVAGPATLAHAVDTVCWFEGDRDLFYRILRANKNRFGSTDEIGIFEMGERGLVSSDETSMFISSERGAPGSCISVAIEGARPLLVEIEALVAASQQAYPKRVAQGVDVRRVELILAILAQKAGINMLDSDVFVKIVGGISIKDPAIDLAVAVALASAFNDRSPKRPVVAIGELSLLGSIAKVSQLENRLKHAHRHGYRGVLSAKKYSSVASIFSRITAKR